MIRIYTDAASKGHPGPSGVGILYIYEQQQYPLSIFLLKNYTNHEAEFIAQILALYYIYKTLNVKSTLIMSYTDSKLVSQSVSTQHCHPKYRALLDELLQLYQVLPNANLSWIPEAQNKGADRLAKQALHKKHTTLDTLEF